MKIILRKDTDGLGKKGDVLEVADGFGRNFLVPTGQAMPASDGAVAQAAAMRRSRDLKDARDRESAETVAAALVAKAIVIEARSGAEGKLFGSVGPADIVAAIATQTGAEVERRRLVLHEPIRTTGRHEVPVRLHADVEVVVTVEVAPTTP